MDRFPKEPLYLNIRLIGKMKKHVAEVFPEEACGLIAGKGQVGHIVIQATNILHSQVRFRMDPRDQLEAFNKMEHLGLEMLAIYHSHPSGPATPSETDLAEAYYPEIASVIWSYNNPIWQVHAYRIAQGQFIEIEINPDK